MGGVKQVEPEFSQWWPVNRHKAIGTNSNTKKSFKNFFFYIVGDQTLEQVSQGEKILYKF